MAEAMRPEHEESAAEEQKSQDATDFEQSETIQSDTIPTESAAVTDNEASAPITLQGDGEPTGEQGDGEPTGEQRDGDSERGHEEHTEITEPHTSEDVVAEAPQVQVTQPADPPEEARTAAQTRSRADSTSTTATAATAPADAQRGSTRSSLVFVIGALEAILASKDAAKIKGLKESTQHALDTIKGKADPRQIDPRVLFEPLRLATEATTETVVTTALDCIGKLISYSYFSLPTQQTEDTPAESLIDQAIDTICDCFIDETTSDKIQLQIIISLLAAVLNDKVVVHGAGLLKAVRQMYNIFLHSKNTRNQQVAQGTLAQMVGTVFERAKSRLAAKEARSNLARLGLGGTASTDQLNSGSQSNGDSRASLDGQRDDVGISDEAIVEPRDTPAEKVGGEKITLQTFEKRGSFDEERMKEGPTTVTRVRGRNASAQTVSSQGDDHGTPERSVEDDEDEIYMKDAFLVFRAMCKISIKSLRPEEIADLKSQGMRTKLLSLHIIHTVLFNHITLFLSPLATIRSSSSDETTPFTQAVKQFLCQSLSRNGASTVNRVFEVASEIFWMMLKHLRVILKKEVEVFWKEIYLNILDNRNAPTSQKQCFLNVLERFAEDPRALVEAYLNYDCDRLAADNMFQRTIEQISRITSMPVVASAIQQHAFHSQASKPGLADWQTKGTVPPSLSTVAIGNVPELDQSYPPEYAMKQQALDCMIKVLRSMILWAQQSALVSQPRNENPDSKGSREHLRESTDIRPSFSAGLDTPLPGTPTDDPSQLELAKARKTALVNAVKQFNFKPKKGIKVLIEHGFINSKTPKDIAQFLLTNEQLDKAAIGEYLGEGDQENVAIMHAFVDSMDFTKTRFVDALRRFLQSFRLPGEAQKIDRFMLKYAERYIAGNPNAFANADTAYVLAYSVIMLNTDQHSQKMKGRRMTPEDFIKNNRGINDNQDLPEEYLQGIYEEIAHNEIVLDTERENAAKSAPVQAATGFAAGIGSALSGNARDLQNEAYLQRSEQISNKTEQLFRSLLRAQRRDGSRSSAVQFIPATSFKHVGPMLDVTWMSFLTALSNCAKETNNLETVRHCMDGLRLAIQISCLFDLESPRMAFVSAIAKFTNLYNLSEMQAKNMEALRALLDIAFVEGNALKESWRDILECVSQLDRFQLLAEGVPLSALPDLKMQPGHARSKSRSSLQVPDKSKSRQAQYRAEVAEESKSSDIVNAVDRIFTSSYRLSGDAIVHFVRALTLVSLQEIQSSGQSQEPRTYSLQKVVEVGEYNMERVRFEWTSIWQVLGEHFIEVGTQENTKIVHFAMDFLRQLSMRFLTLEELPGFKFQKDFLKPFEHIIGNTKVPQVKELVIHSLVQMIQARGDNIRSGWRTIFGVFTVAAREPFEGVVNLAYENVMHIYNTRLGLVMQQGAFADLVVCLTEFSKNARFQKKSLQAIEALKAIIPKMLKTPECPLSIDGPRSTKQPNRQTQEEQFWFPVLFAFHDVLMTGDDLEVRSRALNYLFDSLIKYGKDFPQEFWDTIWRQLLYPIFMVLKSKSEMTKVVNHEELSVWLSTTMIQALRNMMSLFTHYFQSLEYMLDRFLDLLALCICQENDTLARIGSNCLQTLILSNVNKFSIENWSQIVACFVDLFARTEATALFSAAAASLSTSTTANGGSVSPTPRAPSSSIGDLPLAQQPLEKVETNGESSTSTAQMSISTSSSGLSNGNASAVRTEVTTPSTEPRTPGLEDYKHEASVQQTPVVVTAARRRFFNQIITKCVLQLLMIETVNELFSNNDVYSRIPSQELLRLMSLLKKSYRFAKRFNDDLELRNRLFEEGFMKQPPNLLKQESGSASVYINILFRMYRDEREERRNNRDQTEAALVPLCLDIIHAYTQLREDTQQRNIMTWRAVVVDVIEGYADFPQAQFEKHAATFAPLMTALMSREMGIELQRAVQTLLHRILEIHYGNMPPLGPSTPTTPGAGVVASSPRQVFGSRRSSRAGAGGVNAASAAR